MQQISTYMKFRAMVCQWWKWYEQNFDKGLLGQYHLSSWVRYDTAIKMTFLENLQ